MQGLGTGTKRSPSRTHIIYQQDLSLSDPAIWAMEGPLDVATPCRCIETHLRTGISHPLDRSFPNRHVDPPAQRSSQQSRLVVPALSQPPRMKRHRNDDIDGNLLLDPPICHQPAQGLSQCASIAVLEPVHGEPYRALE
jgi:hypothetical protein